MSSNISIAPLTPSQYVEITNHLVAAKLYSLAAIVMLFYDIVITFGDEVEKIWKKRFSGATVLWFVNRYANALGYIIIIVSFHSEWPASRCNRYIFYPEILKTITDGAVGVVFIIRLYAIYSRSRVILVVFGCLLAIELGIKTWAWTDGIALQLPPGLVGCILTGKSDRRFTWTWIAELIFDSCVFFATLYKAFHIYRNTVDHSAFSLVRIILRDGVIYYAAIFTANILTVVFLLVAAPDIKAINASFSNMMTSLMVARLMLNLRTEAERRNLSQKSGQATTFVRDNFTATAPHSKRTVEETIMGNLGEDVSWWDEEEWKEDEHDVYRRQGDMIELVPRYQPPEDEADPAAHDLRRSW